MATLTAALVLAAMPAMAQDQGDTPRNPDLSQGAELLSEGMKLFLKGLMAEGEEGWGRLVDWLDDVTLYEAPERLPNGDIIIRRKVPLTPDAPEATEL